MSLCCDAVRITGNKIASDQAGSRDRSCSRPVSKGGLYLAIQLCFSLFGGHSVILLCRCRSRTALGWENADCEAAGSAARKTIHDAISFAVELTVLGHSGT